MKPSIAIREALKDYTADGYLCNSLDRLFPRMYPDMGYTERDNMASDVKSTFMPTIESEDTSCLTLYLARTNLQYKYYAYRFGHDSKACFKRRVAWWERLIIDLEERGL